MSVASCWTRSEVDVTPGMLVGHVSLDSRSRASAVTPPQARLRSSPVPAVALLHCSCDAQPSHLRALQRARRRPKSWRCRLLVAICQIRPRRLVMGSCSEIQQFIWWKLSCLLRCMEEHDLHRDIISDPLWRHTACTESAVLHNLPLLSTITPEAVNLSVL
nr:hypothetical protein CFP56_19585 [Quercus suber]